MSTVAQWNDPPKGRKFLKGTGMGVKPHSLKALIVSVSCASTTTRFYTDNKKDAKVNETKATTYPRRAGDLRDPA